MVHVFKGIRTSGEAQLSLSVGEFGDTETETAEGFAQGLAEKLIGHYVRQEIEAGVAFCGPCDHEGKFLCVWTVQEQPAA